MVAPSIRIDSAGLNSLLHPTDSKLPKLPRHNDGGWGASETTGSGKLVNYEYHPSPSEEKDRALFEAMVGRLYKAEGGMLTQVLNTPEVVKAWRCWQDEACAVFPATITFGGPDAVAKKPHHNVTPSLAMPHSHGAHARGPRG
jgi:hypothetical protein